MRAAAETGWNELRRHRRCGRGGWYHPRSAFLTRSRTPTGQPQLPNLLDPFFAGTAGRRPAGLAQAVRSGIPAAFPPRPSPPPCPITTATAAPACPPTCCKPSGITRRPYLPADRRRPGPVLPHRLDRPRRRHRSPNLQRLTPPWLQPAPAHPRPAQPCSRRNLPPRPTGPAPTAPAQPCPGAIRAPAQPRPGPTRAPANPSPGQSGLWRQPGPGFFRA